MLNEWTWALLNNELCNNFVSFVRTTKGKIVLYLQMPSLHNLIIWLPWQFLTVKQADIWIISPLKLCPILLLIYICWIIWGWVAILKSYLFTRPWLFFIMWPVFTQFDVNCLFLKDGQECKPKCATRIDGYHTSTPMRLQWLHQNWEKVLIDLPHSIHWLNTYLQSTYSMPGTGMKPGLYIPNSAQIDRKEPILYCLSQHKLFVPYLAIGNQREYLHHRNQQCSKLGMVFLQLINIYLLPSH